MSAYANARSTPFAIFKAVIRIGDSDWVLCAATHKTALIGRERRELRQRFYVLRYVRRNCRCFTRKIAVFRIAREFLNIPRSKFLYKF